jgi:osmoprotectant transport system substrate-binding protein
MRIYNMAYLEGSITSISAALRRMLYRSLIVILGTSALCGCSDDDEIVVGAKAFTEGYLLGHMAVMILEDAGYNVDEQFGVASAAMRVALETGQIDLYYEYTGTAYTVYHGGSDKQVMADSASVLAAVRQTDLEEYDLQWLRPLPFNNTYALLMRRDDANKRELSTLSDLARTLQNGTDITIAVNTEFYERADGYKALSERYGLQNADVQKFDAGLIYSALAEGDIDIGMGFSTDGRIAAFDLVELSDDLGFFPRYNPAAVVREELLKKHPDVEDLLLRLNSHLDTETIQRLNAEVDIEHRDPRKVVRRWLVAEGLIGTKEE